MCCGNIHKGLCVRALEGCSRWNAHLDSVAMLRDCVGGNTGFFPFDGVCVDHISFCQNIKHFLLRSAFFVDPETGVLYESVSESK